MFVHVQDVTAAAHDLITEEDNVKPSVESSLKRRKSARLQYQDQQQEITTAKKGLRSSYKQRSIPSQNLSEVNNRLDQTNEEPIKRSYRTRTENSNRRVIEDRKTTGKYSSKIRESEFIKAAQPEEEARFSKHRQTTKVLNEFGLNPETLETTEPVTERERFVPSSRRTKSYKYSTEAIQEQVLSSSTLKPRYQLYQAKDRKKLLDKRFGGSKDNKIDSEENLKRETGMIIMLLY